MTPTIDRPGPWRERFHSREPNEPPHVHVDRDEASAKFWLAPVALARNIGFAAKELNQIQRLVLDREAAYLEAWYEFHGS